MKRTKSTKTPDLILTADWHLREDQPICRTDDFWETQWNKVDQVSELQKKFDCPVVHAGDLFHNWKSSPWLLSTAISLLPKKFFTVFGNHDIPQHNLELDHKSGVNTLRQAGIVRVLPKGSFGQEPGKIDFRVSKTEFRMVGVWHQFVWDGEKIPWPGCDEMTAMQVLKKYPEFDLIVTGDHHKPFTETYQGRLLVNCGCLTRQASDYANHKPCVWLWYADTNTVEPYYLDIPEGVVSRDHIEKKEQIDKRMEAFISRLSDEWDVSISFEDNLERFFSSNHVKKSVKELVYKAIDEL
jgi:DNA repair exonuclease SbcCD nuclease subunit